MYFKKNNLLFILFMVLVCCVDAIGSVYGNIVNNNVSEIDSKKSSISLSFMNKVDSVGHVSALNAMNFDVEKVDGVDYVSASNAKGINGHSNTIKVSGKAGSDPWSLVSGMELQDTYAKVYNNTICVNNTAGYVSGNCAYGISYVQTTSGSHYYDVENNTVKVYNADYAVYLSSPATGIIQGNNLTAIGNTTKTGNNAVYAPGITPGSNP